MKKMSFLPRLIRLDFKVFDKLANHLNSTPPLGCKVFGHSMISQPMNSNILHCNRFGCTYTVKWDRPPPLTMPKCKPPRKEEKNHRSSLLVK